MAGLLAARVLADHFEEVTVLERDPIGDDVLGPRKGVPQGRHLHVLLKRGELTLGALFPDLLPALVAGGAVRLDVGRDLRYYHFSGWKRPFESGMVATFMSRPFLEAAVRRRVFSLPRVRRLDRCEARGLVLSPGGERVVGVRLKPQEGPEQELPADLVVEASGRGSRLPAWLEEAGFGRPVEALIPVQVAYASRVYRLPPGTHCLYIFGTPPRDRRFGILAPVEGGRCIVGMGGLLGEEPPTEPEGFLEFARGLPTDALYRLLREAEPLGDTGLTRFPADQRRYYERMERLPEGLAVVGDALMCFNPIYGQGMTNASVEAVVLGQSLAEQRRRQGRGQLRGLTRRYHAAVARTMHVYWATTTGEDMRYPELAPQRPLLFPLTSWYLSRVHRACMVDTLVYERFLRIVHMLEGPEPLLAPRMAWRVLRAARAA